MVVVDFFFALRPLVLVPAWSFLLLGHGLGAGDGFPAQRFLLLSAVLAGVHLVNQVVDAESDRINAKGFFLQRGIFRARTYVLVASLLLGVALGTAWALDVTPLGLTAAAALGLTYSLPPLRWSARPGWDLAANAVGYGGLATWIGAAEIAASPLWAARLGACMLAVAAVFLHTTLLDLEGDRRTGKRSSGVALGVQRTRRVAMLSALAGAAAAAAARAPFLLGASLGVAGLATASSLAPRRCTSRTVSTGGTALFALAAGLQQPVFLLLLAFLVIATRTYYRRRFRLAYPSLLPPRLEVGTAPRPGGVEEP